MWLLLATAGWARIVDRVVVVVGDRIITASDVAFETEFDRHDESPLSALEGPGYSMEDRLVHFALFRAFAAEIEVFRPSEAEVAARRARFRESWSNAEEESVFLERWGLDEPALAGFLFSRLVAERYALRNLALARGSGDSGADPYEAWVKGLEARATIRRP